MKQLYIYVAACALMVSGMVQAQIKSDSVSLDQLMKTVLDKYPELKKAEKDLTAADAKTALSRSSKLPDVVFLAGYNRVGPVTTFNLGGRDVHLMPENVYNASVSLTENLYDFGKTDKNVAVDEKNKELQTRIIDQVRQRLTQAVLVNYYSLCYIQEALRIKDEQLSTLEKHVQFVQKKQATGSATQYDLLSTQVKISTVENQRIDLQTALDIQLNTLNNLLGTDKGNRFNVKKETQVVAEPASLDALCTLALTNRQEMKLAEGKVELAKLKLEAIGVQNNPSLNLQAVGGFKNGYLNTKMEDVGKLNYNVGLGLRVPLFDANRTKYAKIQASAALENSTEDLELQKRNITGEVVENRINVLGALKKIKTCALQVQQATKAYSLAETSYQNGVITNLDLLDSYTAVSESKLALFKAETDYQICSWKLRLATGETFLTNEDK